MANLQNYIFLGLVLAASLLFSPAFSQTCVPRPPYSNCADLPQTCVPRPPYSNCADLPVFNASLHYNYYPTISTLSFAFSAPPPNPNGWVSWTFKPANPLIGEPQGFLAYKDSNGATVLKTYNSEESKLLYQKAEFSNGLLSIYATVELPKGTRWISHAWRVGPGMKDRVPQMEGLLESYYLDARGLLRLPKDTTWMNHVSRPRPPTDCGSHDKHKDGRLFMLYQCSA